jgi:hypothetical protein
LDTRADSDCTFFIVRLVAVAGRRRAVAAAASVLPSNDGGETVTVGFALFDEDITGRCSKLGCACAKVCGYLPRLEQPVGSRGAILSQHKHKGTTHSERMMVSGSDQTQVLLFSFAMANNCLKGTVMQASPYRQREDHEHRG